MDHLQDQDSDGEDDPTKLLDHWLGELNTLGKVSWTTCNRICLTDRLIPRAWGQVSAMDEASWSPQGQCCDPRIPREGRDRESRSIGAPSSTSTTAKMKSLTPSLAS